MSLIESILLIVTFAGAGLSAFLYVQVKRRDRERTARWMKRQQSLESELGKLRGSIAELKAQLNECSRSEATSQPSANALQSINLNRRAQAMRLFRRGESEDKVAELTGLAKPDAALLRKVYRAITNPVVFDTHKTAATRSTAQQSSAPERAGPLIRKAVFPDVSHETSRAAAQPEVTLQ